MLNKTLGAFLLKIRAENGFRTVLLEKITFVSL